MRLRPKYLWWAVLGFFGLASFFGAPIPRDWVSTMKWVTSIEAWGHDHVAHPFIFALIVGLATGTVVVPEIWGAVRRQIGKPKIDVFLDRGGVRVVETRASDLPAAPRTPDTKWIQITVKGATDLPLIDCEARL
jgi:hypothetical protein